jgi:hypothetical protein
MADLHTQLMIDRIAGVTSCILGDPGIAKTEGVNAAITNLDVLPAGYVLPEGHTPKAVNFYASSHESTDISGYPVLTEDGQALSFKVMQKLQALVPGDALVVDEITVADDSQLKPYLQLLRNPRISVNDWVGPEHVTRVCMGNLATSGNLDYLYNPVVGNGMALYEFTGPTVDEWITYAMSKGIHPVILAGIKIEGPTLLLDWNPSRDRNPTHRSWFKASAQLYAAESLFPEGVPIHIRMAQIASCVGDPAALDVETLLHLQDKLVPYETVVASPTNAPVPDGMTDPAAQFLMATHVANKCVPDDWASVTQYIERFPIELQATIINPIVARFPVLMTTTEYANFASRTSGLL